MEEAPLPTRFEVELEFVQSLCNIQYLHYLAQCKKLSDPKFLAYLKYLEYWREPEYSKFLVYPNCLHVLTLLQNPEFRKEIVRQDVVNVLMNDMVERWYGTEKTVEQEQESVEEPVAVPTIVEIPPENELKEAVSQSAGI